MNWFPVLTAVTVLVVTFFGTYNPVRAVELQLSALIVFLAWVVIQVWNLPKPMASRVRNR